MPSGECLSVSIEITPLVAVLGGKGVSLEAVMLDKDGAAILDMSCNKVAWEIASGASLPGGPDDSDVRFPVIEFPDSQNSRIVTLSGSYGIFKVSATSPNGDLAVLEVVLQ
jgi:hypothetical protein